MLMRIGAFSVEDGALDLSMTLLTYMTSLYLKEIAVTSFLLLS